MKTKIKKIENVQLTYSLKAHYVSNYIKRSCSVQP